MKHDLRMRTLKTWIRYRAKDKRVMGMYALKKDATKHQRNGEAVLQLKGFYFPGTVKGFKWR